MKKTLIGIIFGLVSMLSFGQQTSDSATLILRGTVPAIVSVNVTPSAQAQNLTMNSAGTYTVEVGTLQYRSNSDFNVSVTPSNSTSFIMVDASGNQIPYTFLVNGVSYQPGDNIISQGRTRGIEELTVTIQYTITDPLPAPGEYEDILTFNISGQ